MADTTGIEWTDKTWNPIAGCSLVSAGCTNCYAMKMAGRIEAMGTAPHYAGLTQPSKAGPVWTGKIAVAPDHVLLKPLAWRKPARIFVNSMSDLFHESVPDETIDRVFAVMALADQHAFQVLTKRPERMREYLTRSDPLSFPWTVIDAAAAMGLPAPQIAHDPFLANVWLGVSVEDQATADARIPILVDTPAAVPWISAEPLLGPLDLTKYFHAPIDFRRGLAWVVAGGESGPGARPMHPDWARSLRDQCATAGVPFFFKQWGEWLDEGEATAAHMAPGDDVFGADGWPKGPKWHYYDADNRGGGGMIRVGKARAGRLLDGVLHDAWPEAR